MYFVMMDGEGKALIEAAAEMAHAALAARAARVDPDEMLTRSLNMSRIKTGDIIRQCSEPPLGSYSDLHAAEKHAFDMAIGAYLQSETDGQRDQTFKIIQAFCIRRARRPLAIVKDARE